MICRQCKSPLRIQTDYEEFKYISCTNPKCGHGFYARLRWYPRWEYVSIKQRHVEDRQRVGYQSDPYEGYNTGLGTYVKSRDHHKKILKERGLQESG